MSRMFLIEAVGFVNLYVCSDRAYIERCHGGGGGGGGGAPAADLRLGVVVDCL